MEQFFKPTRRLQDLHDYIFDEPLGFTEVQLAVCVEAFLSHRWDWSDFQAFLKGDEREMWKVMWITENTLVWVEDEYIGLNFDLTQDYAKQQASFTAPSGETHNLFLAKNMESASLPAKASNIFWHAVTASNCVKLSVEHWFSWFGLCSGPALLQFFEASPSLERLEFVDFDFEEAHCRAFATLERTRLEVIFEGCLFGAQGAKYIFIEWLRHSQIVTRLEGCAMEDNTISALSGNSSVKKASIGTTDGRGGDRRGDPIRSLPEALAGNQGIENLQVLLLQNAETWSLLSRSLWAQPRIQSVRLTFSSRLSAASKTSIMNTVLQLVQCNTLVCTIDLPDDTKDEEFFQNSILPRLEMNRNCFEDQRQALTRADPSARGQLLGLALHVVRYNPDLLFRFLSENVPAFVQPDEVDPIIRSGQKRKA